MSVTDRFLKYVSYPTASGEERPGKCSTDGQYKLAQELEKELKELGLSQISVSEYGIVHAVLEGVGEPIALLAHMDTSPSASGDGIRPRIVKDYRGGEIKLSEGVFLRPEEFESLKNQIGHDLIVTDGTTLLGGDDKAGIAIIMTALERIIASTAKHHPLEILFTTDEEIGTGVHHVKTDGLISAYGYTVDGGSCHLINRSNFNAINMEVEVHGRSVHPGSARHKMINAIEYAIDFDRSLPRYERPEFTDGREGFFHLNEISGNEELTKLSYLLRDFDEGDLRHRRFTVEKTAEELNRTLGYEAIVCHLTECYHNMEPILAANHAVVERIERAYKDLKIDYSFEDIRGGTDGSQLSYRGLPCPNLGTGDYNCHGRFEYVDIDEMETMVAVVVKMMCSE